jgi:hypothetical protein
MHSVEKGGMEKSVNIDQYQTIGAVKRHFGDGKMTQSDIF